PEGLYCPAGDFYIDPWRPVERAVITHAHADHARGGHQHYLSHVDAAQILKTRLGGAISLQTLKYAEVIKLGGVQLSLHPAGHVLGSSQIRMVHQGQVWVVSGDYKIEAEPSCQAFEPLRCDVFVTESTFALPIYCWEPQSMVIEQISAWWQANAAKGIYSVLYTYSLGKAQRLAIALPEGPVWVHPAVDAIHACYRNAGRKIPLMPCWHVEQKPPAGSLLLVPPAIADSSALSRLAGYEDASVSGWMRLRGIRKRRALDRGFVMSDHADWPGLLWAIRQTGAQKIFVTHGQVDVLVRYLCEQGLDAAPLQALGWGEDV
ncbi:MAG: ligase-associated DNA damage response exonuclease, partial [Betaproteobacteria bacterium]|nr:ligase-associated DNA damage response exonuclease [Betaproteobacteria bacterium]